MNQISVAMNIALTDVFLHCIASKRTLLTSVDPSTIVFVGFFHKKYLPAMNKYIMVIPPARVVCTGNT